MSQENEFAENLGREATKVLGSDIHPISLEERIEKTPVNDVEWSGLRGQSYCRSKDPEVQELLQQHGVDGIMYSLKGEPDFSKVAIAKVKISDMTEDLSHDKTSTYKKILETDWAEENGIHTVGELKLFLKEHHYVIHEGQDGVTEYVIEEKIHQTFRHYGGRGKLRGYNNPNPDRMVQSKLSEGAVKVNKTIVKGTEEFDRTVTSANDFIEAQTDKFLSKDLSELNRAGLDEATRSALFAATLSITKNTIDVVKGDTGADQAAKNILIDTSSAAVLAYATGVTQKALNLTNKSDAALLVTGTVQISKQVFAYCNGELDEQQLLENVAETAAYLAAAQVGKTLGAAMGDMVAGPFGALVGQYVGEMVTTAICTTVIDTIHYEKASNQYNQQMMALAHRAEVEIRMSQERLEYLIRNENRQLIEALNAGYDKFMEGILYCDYDYASAGLAEIGSQFGIEAQKLTQGHVVRGNIFGKKNRVIRMG